MTNQPNNKLIREARRTVNDIDFNNIIPEMDYYVRKICTPSWKVDPQVTYFTDITYLTAGKAEYTINGERCTVKKGDLLYVPNGAHRAAVSTPDDLMVCYCADFFLRDRSGAFVELPLPLISSVGDSPFLCAAFDEITRLWLRRDYGYQLQITANLCLIIHHLLDLSFNMSRLREADTRVSKAISYITDNYAEPITVESMAQMFRLHPVYFGRLFHETMGRTFKQYLLSFRLNCAENMLRSGEYSVSDVAHRCGFSDVFYFSKMYKLSRGVPPSRERRFER
jgi:AraC-like DNA-binding protein/mannose-6-phosphate isomerase-like protein (cupin superfamily)